jgi:hypothetical protein
MSFSVNNTNLTQIVGANVYNTSTRVYYLNPLCVNTTSDPNALNPTLSPPNNTVCNMSYIKTVAFNMYTNGTWNIPDPFNFSSIVVNPNSTNCSTSCGVGTVVSNGKVVSGYLLSRWGSDPFAYGSAPVVGPSGNADSISSALSVPINDQQGISRLYLAGDHVASLYRYTSSFNFVIKHDVYV